MDKPRSLELLVISALKQEIKGLIDQFRPQTTEIKPGYLSSRYWETVVNGNSIGFRVCGVGKKRSVKDISSLLNQIRPRQILIIGFSGSLISSFSIGNIAIVESTQHEKSTISFDLDLTQKIEHALKNAQKPYRLGKAVTVESVVDTAKAKTHLHSTSQADCVDMESYHLASLAKIHHIPIAMIRVISDYADETIGLDFNAIPRGKWASRRYFLCRPRLWYPLIKLRIDIAKAVASLTTAAQQALLSILSQ